jgi:hypothetical protein
MNVFQQASAFVGARKREKYLTISTFFIRQQIFYFLPMSA